MHPAREDDIAYPSICYCATKGLLEARTPVDPSCEDLRQDTPALLQLLLLCAAGASHLPMHAFQSSLGQMISTPALLCRGFKMESCC